MADIREVTLIGFAALLASLCAFAIHSLFFPPFTDAEIQRSLVDTWGVNTIITTAGLAVAFLAGTLSILLSWRGTRLVKHLSITSVTLSAAAAGLLVLYHATLTERATMLTGQEFGGILGLGLGPI
jgi:hypothetical protein